MKALQPAVQGFPLGVRYQMQPAADMDEVAPGGEEPTDLRRHSRIAPADPVSSPPSVEKGQAHRRRPFLQEQGAGDLSPFG